jgi:histone H3/H4
MSEVLVVTSKIKKLIREKSGFNTSADLIEGLSQRVEQVCIAAIERAKADGRRTVKGRDLEQSP